MGIIIIKIPPKKGNASDCIPPLSGSKLDMIEKKSPKGMNINKPKMRNIKNE